MKYINYFIVLVCGLFIAACSNGAPGEVSNNAYGNLQSAESIALGGSAPTIPNYQVPVTVLQSFVESGVCINIESNVPVLDGSFAPPFTPPNTHYGANLCGANQAYINGHSDLFGAVSNNLSTFIANNSAGVQTVKLYRITYDTPGQSQYYSGGATTKETVSGLVIVPQGPTIKGIVLYYHPTVFSKYGVPSMDDIATQIMLSSVYASQGYIVVAPDYVGQGVDTSVMHPYVLYAQTNALDGINMLKATREFLATESAAAGNKILATQNMNLYITSYSEGAPYALWASRMLQDSKASSLSDNHLNLKLTVGIEGAYDLTNSMIPYAYDHSNNSSDASKNYYNVSPGMLESSPFYLPGKVYATPVGALPIESGIQQTLTNIAMSVSKSSLSGYAFTSFINYQYTSAAFPLFFPNKNFFNMSTCLSLESYVTSAINPLAPSLVPVNCPIQDTLANLFMNTSYTDSNISTTISTSAMWNTGFFTGGESASVLVNNVYNGGYTNNSVGVFAQDVLTDPQIMKVIAIADTWSYTTNSPTALIYMNYDSTVTNRSSIRACSGDGVKGRSPDQVTCFPVDNTQLYTAREFAVGPAAVQVALMVDHSQAPYILSLIALNQIKSHP